MSMKDKGGEAEFQPWVYHNEPYSDPLPAFENLQLMGLRTKMDSLDDNFDKFMELFSNTDDFMRGLKDAKKFRLLQMNDALW